MNKYQKIGEYLVTKSVLTQDQRDEALHAMMTTNRRLGEVIIDLGYASEDDVTECLANQFDLPFVELEGLNPTPQALRVVSPEFAMKRLFLPVHIDEKNLHCVIGDPLDVDLTDLVSQSTGKRLNQAIAAPTPLREKISDIYRIINDPSRPIFDFGNPKRTV